MDSYSLSWKSSAERELRKLPPPIIDRLVALAESLRSNPYPNGATKMVATQNTWRLREGEYRMIYKVVSNILTVEIIRVGHRREVYR
jgi:mRNA interferase RelE/StbE